MDRKHRDTETQRHRGTEACDKIDRAPPCLCVAVSLCFLVIEDGITINECLARLEKAFVIGILSRLYGFILDLTDANSAARCSRDDLLEFCSPHRDCCFGCSLPARSQKHSLSQVNRFVF